MDVDGTPVDSVVGISHRRAGQQMAQAILKDGYEHIAFLGTKIAQDHRARKRFEGFTEVLAKAGVDEHPQVRLEAVNALRQSGTPPAASTAPRAR